MSRNLVVQFFIKPDNFSEPNYNSLGANDQLVKYSLKSAEIYAERISADYKLISEPKVNWKHPTFERFDLFYNKDWWVDYDRILYLDTDVIVWPKAPSVFELYPDLHSFKPVFDKRALKKSVGYHEKISKGTCLESIDPAQLRSKRFNAGVFVVTRESALAMKPFLNCAELDSDDNCMLIYAMLKSGVEVEYMDYKFNKKNGGPSWYFGHAFGQEKFNVNFSVIKKAKEIFDVIT